MPSEGQPGSRPELQNYNTLDRSTPENFGSQVGQALDQAGNMLAQHAVARQQMVNETNVLDTYVNQFSPKLEVLRQQYMKLEGKDAEDQFGAYQQQVNNLVTQTRANLPNPMQQKAFDERAASRTERELSMMSGYAAQQSKQWQWTTHNAAIDNLSNDSAANYNQPQHLAMNAAEIDKQTFNYFSTHGYDPNTPQGAAMIKDQMNSNQAKMWSAVIERQALYDPGGASQVLDAKTKDGTLPGDTQLKLQTRLKPQLEMLQSQAAVSRATGGETAQQLALIAQQKGVAVSDILGGWASEGSVTDPTVENPKSHATGVGQFLPSTWKDMGGSDEDRFDKQRQMQVFVDHWKQNSDALYKDLGRQPQPWEVYAAHQQGIAGAEALLHADPSAAALPLVGGNARALVDNGMPANATAGQVLNYLQNYYQRHAAMYSPQGTPTADNISTNYAQHLQDLAEQARRDFPNDPGAVARYQGHYIQEAARTIEAQKMSDNANWRTVDNAITGPQGFADKGAFMADSNAKAAYDAIYERDHSVADKIDAIYEKKNLGLWNPAPTPETDNTFGSIWGWARQDPQNFAKQDLHPYYGTMPFSQWNDLNNLQQKIQNKDQTETDKAFKISTSLSNAKDIIAQAGNRLYKDQTPYSRMDKNGGSQAQLKYYKFVHDVEQDLNDFRENNNGKIPTYQQQRDLVTQRLFPNGLNQPQAKPTPGSPPGQGEALQPAVQVSTEQPASAPAQVPEKAEIDFGKLKPENQDEFSQAVAHGLQSAGKLVNDDTISAAKSALKLRNPDIETQWNKPKKAGE